MQAELAALVVHDLKNALGALEAELDTLRRAPEAALARQAHARCAEMRREFMMFLTLYGGAGADVVNRTGAIEGANGASGSASTSTGGSSGSSAANGAHRDLRAQCADESPIDFVQSLVDRAEAPGDSACVVRLGDCSRVPPFWYFDFRLVRMAMDAALHNALRFARREVVVGAREEQGCLVLSIDDDGPGLGAEDDCATSTGLGTELCNAVARAHGTAAHAGRALLVDRPGGGARFELWLG